jgi:hypothetical protein
MSGIASPSLRYPFPLVGISPNVNALFLVVNVLRPPIPSVKALIYPDRKLLPTRSIRTMTLKISPRDLLIRILAVLLSVFYVCGVLIAEFELAVQYNAKWVEANLYDRTMQLYATQRTQY